MVLGNLATTDPPAGAMPAYPAAEALDRARRMGYEPHGEVRVTLRRATYLDHYRGRLVWLVEYARDPMILGGPPGLSTQDRAAAIASGVCEFVVVLDASVGGGTYRLDKRYGLAAEIWLDGLQVCWSNGASLVGGVP